MPGLRCTWLAIARWCLGLHDAGRQNPMHHTAGFGKAERAVAARVTLIAYGSLVQT